jgi:signal transduction histidine kinase
MVRRAISGVRERLIVRSARTIRLKLTLLYGVVFLVTGVVLLTIGYVLVRHNLNAHLRLGREAQEFGLAPQKLGLAPHPFHSTFNPPGSTEAAALFKSIHDALVASALHRLVFEYAGALVAMTAISVAAGWLLAGRALAPLREITATARRVSAENLGERIGLEGPADELKELADTFDGMLARLDSTFASQRHFVANASHELRTPLAIMRTEIDVALADPDASTGELRAMGEAVRETIDRSEGLIAALLTLARSEAVTGRDERVALPALAGDCITDLHRRAQEVGIELTAELEPAQVRGDPALLERMIGNLIDNGIRYNEPGGFLRVATSTSGGRAHVVVANGGNVIDPEVAAALTEPFRRLSRTSGGYGLGLSIVRSVAEAYGGTVAVTAPATGGLVVAVELPADASPPSVDVPRRHRTLTKS